MFIYYSILVPILLFGLPVIRRNSPTNRKVYLSAVFFVLFIIMAIRGEQVGTDVRTYGVFFSRIARSHDFSSYMNEVSSAPIYNLLNKTVSLVGDYRTFMVFSAATILFSTAVYIYHFSNNVVISTYCFVTLYGYLNSFNISRQFLGVAFILLALCERKKNNLAWCVAFAILAVGTHSISFIALPLLLINTRKIGDRFFRLGMYGSVAIAAFFAFLYNPMVNLFSLIFPRYQMYLLGGSATLSYSAFSESKGDSAYLSLFFALFIAAAIIVQAQIPKKIRLSQTEKSELRFLVIAVSIGVAIGFSGGRIMAVARSIHFFEIHAICLIPNTIGKFRKEKNLLFLLLLIILIIPYALLLSRNYAGIAPYTTMWR